MRRILGISISILSVFFGVGIIVYYYCIGGYKALVGAGFVLAILGAPTTLLNVVMYMLGFNNGFMYGFVLVFILYIIQYQIIALLVYRPIKVRATLLLFVVLFILVVVGASIAYHLIVPHIEPGANHKRPVPARHASK